MSLIYKRSFHILFALAVLSAITFSQTSVWSKQNIGLNQTTKSIKTVNASVVWLCGPVGVFNTSNGGNSWTLRLSGNYTTIEAVNESTAFATKNVSPNTTIYRTSDFGLHWFSVHTESTFINGIKMFDQFNGIAVGDPKDSIWRVLRTTDGGTTWNFEKGSPKIIKCEVGNMNSLAIANKHFVWFGVVSCGGFKIYKSSDMGITWKSYATPFDDSYGIWFNDSLHGVVAFGSGFFYTADGGENWKWNNQFISSPLNVCGTANGDFWGTSDSAIYNSSDGGATWIEKYRDTLKGLGHLSFISNNGAQYGWTAAPNGNLIKHMEIPTAIHQNQFIHSNDFMLHQNYPNPFNPTTTIAFSLSYEGTVSLKIFDALGREVEVLVNEIREAGKYSEIFNASSLTSGMYFYRLQTGSYVETKKLVLIK